MSARNTLTNLTVARKAGLFLVATAGALTLSTGGASALSPEPGPAGPVFGIELPVEPEPEPTPGLEGPGELGIPVPTPDPDPIPQPLGPDDLAPNPEGDDPGFEGPDDLAPNPEGDDPGFEGPDDLAPNPEGDDDVDPVPEPVDPDVLGETAAASELAFTGSDLDTLTTGLALLGAGGLAAVGGVIARRRGRAQA